MKRKTYEVSESSHNQRISIFNFIVDEKHARDLKGMKIVVPQIESRTRSRLWNQKLMLDSEKVNNLFE